jgi:hypothetical protein
MEYFGTWTQCFFKANSLAKNMMKQEIKMEWIRIKQNEKEKKELKNFNAKA